MSTHLAFSGTHRTSTKVPRTNLFTLLDIHVFGYEPTVEEQRSVAAVLAARGAAFPANPVVVRLPNGEGCELFSSDQPWTLSLQLRPVTPYSLAFFFEVAQARDLMIGPTPQ